MAGNRRSQTQTPDRLPPKESGSGTGGASTTHALLGLQRSAGNAATAQLVAETPSSELVVQRSIGSWWKKKFGKKDKDGGDSEISGPTGGHAMTEEEQGGVPSMKELMEQHSKEKNGSSSINTPPPTKEKTESVEDILGQQENAKPTKSVEEQAKEDDDKAFEDIKKTAAILKDPTKTKQDDQSALDAAYSAVVTAAALWKQSPRRLAGAPEDKPKLKEIEALLQDLKWTRDKSKADGAALSPNPELVAKDKDGYVVSTAAKLYQIKSDGSLEAGSVSFTQDVSLEAAPPELEKNGKPGYKLSIGGKDYWVLKTEVVLKHGKFNKVTGPLFAKDPSADDVKQTTLGDCYLQASIASVADRNPGLIKAMMRDNGDDSVTVRLYKVDETDPAHHTYQEQYVKVEKSVPKGTLGQDVYNAGALWVRLLEKAYAAGGFTGTGKAPPTVKSYEGIASGFSRYSMEVLTGEQAQQYFLTGGGGAERASNDVYFTRGLSTGTKEGSPTTAITQVNLPWDVNEINNHATAKAADNYANLMSFKILNDKTKVDTWITFVKTDAIKNMFVARKTDQGQGYAGDITLKDFDDAFKTGSLDATVAAPMLAWIESQKLYPGALGTHKYSQVQLDVFAKIKETLDKGGSVTGGTHKYPSKTTTGTGASGGEAMSGGMVGGHAFSFIGYRANSGQDPAAPAAGDFYFVKIRNPWGNYSRKYDFSKADPGEEVKGGDGVSWLELSEVTKFFETVSFQ